MMLASAQPELTSSFIQSNLNYWVAIVLLVIGLGAMVAKNNLVKKLIGMTIFQTAIILFFVSSSVKDGATLPILDHHGHGEAHGEAAHGDEHTAHAVAHDGHADAHAHQPVEKIRKTHASEILKDHYANPLPHVLMLTAIVVGVATLGVALSLVQRIYKDFGTLEEDEILNELAAEVAEEAHRAKES